MSTAGRSDREADTTPEITVSNPAKVTNGTPGLPFGPRTLRAYGPSRRHSVPVTLVGHAVRRPQRGEPGEVQDADGS